MIWICENIIMADIIWNLAQTYIVDEYGKQFSKYCQLISLRYAIDGYITLHKYATYLHSDPLPYYTVTILGTW